MSNPTNSNSETQFGTNDTSYLAAGKEPGIRKLCTDFYHFMSILPEAKQILEMHNESLDLMIDKLTLFLCLWLGGPRDYVEKHGSPNMMQAHRHLVINESQRDAWLNCMYKAIAKQDFSDEFKKYLKIQIAVPAERIMMTAQS